MDKPIIGFENPLSAGLHPIPANCPICGTQQWDGIRAFGSGAPYEDQGIEDLCLDIEYGVEEGKRWTTCHRSCKQWFRDMVVNKLAASELDIKRFDEIHEAIRNSISSDHGEDVLIAMLGPGFIIPNPYAEAVMR